MAVAFRIQFLFILLIAASVNSVPIGQFFWSIGRKDLKEGLCPLIKPLEPQDYLRHRAYNAGSRTIDEEPRSIKTSLHSLVNRDADHDEEVKDDQSEEPTYDDGSYDEFSRQPHDSLCGNMCTGDYECGPNKKCCPTTCGYACYEPVFVVRGTGL